MEASGKIITTLDQLKFIAIGSEKIHAILNDSEIGRRTASALLWERYGYEVSDWLVRRYRDSQKNGEHPTAFNTEEVPYFPSPWGYREPNSAPVTYTTTTSSPVRSISNKPKTIVVMPDVQAPLHDVELVKKFVSFLGDYQPTELAQVGDFTDSTEISRWVRGKKPEFAGDLAGGFRGARGILADIRDVFNGRIRIVRSNHDDRLELYIEACAPGLASLMDDDYLTFEKVMKFDEYEVEFIRDAVVELAPGWVMAHGDEGSLSPSAGKTAFGLAKNKFGVSTVCGHTHRAGMTSESTGYNGQIRNILTGLEVGHFMDLSKADYLKKKGVAANWQQAFGILEIYGDRVYPRLITVQDGHFSVDGVEY